MSITGESVEGEYVFNILQIRNYKGGTKNDRKGLHKKKCQVVRKVLCAQFFVLNMMRNGMSAQVFVLIIVVGVQATRSGGQSSSACSPYGHF